MFLKSSVGKIKKTANKKQIYETIKYPVINKQENDIYIISRDGDRFDLLANQYYNDSSLWWVIAKANNIFNGSINIKQGIQIRIPYSPDNAIQSYITLNS